MQALWSRAVPIKSSCRCPSCLMPRKAVVRPPNGVPLGRRNRSGNITLFYSTAIASAAALDASWKASKRREVDNALLRVKEEVQMMDDFQQMRLHALGSDRVGELIRMQELEATRENSRIDGSPVMWRPFTLPDPASIPFAMKMSERRENILSLTAPSLQKPDTKLKQPQSKIKQALKKSLSPVGAGSAKAAPIFYPSSSKTSGSKEEFAYISPRFETTDTVRQSDVFCSSRAAAIGSKALSKQDNQRRSSSKRSLLSIRAESIDTRRISQALTEPDLCSTTSVIVESKEKLSGFDDAEKNKGVQKWGTKSRRIQLNNPALGAEKRSRHPIVYYGSVDSLGVSQRALARILLDSKPLDLRKGRSFNAVWASQSTPALDRRKLLLRQASVAEIIYKLAAHHFLITEHLDRKENSTIQIQLPDNRHISFRRDSSKIHQKLEEVLHQQKIIISARFDRGLLPMIEPLQFPQYNWSDKILRNEELDGTAAQEEELLQFFSQARAVDRVLPELCSLLAQHRFAANVHMFNILIIRLCHLQLHHAAAIVISVMQHSGIIQNEVTHAAVLHCYTCCGNHKKFVAYINLMEGVSGKGLSPANRAGPSFLSRQATESLINSHWHVRHAVNDFNDSKEKLQFFKAARTQETYEIIITGFLKFLDTERALEEYSKMVRSGFTPTMRVYDAFLKHCVRTKAWMLGEMIWQTIDDGSRNIPVLTYYWMLQLCAFCNEQHLFNMVVKNAVRHGALRYPLEMDNFRWNSTTFRETLSVADDVDRLEQFLKVPGDEASEDRELDCTGALDPCPANLATLIKQSYMRLVCRNEALHGFCLNVKLRPHYESSAFVHPQITQWVELDTTSGRTILTADSQWPGTAGPGGGPPPKLTLARNPEYRALQLASNRGSAFARPKKAHSCTFGQAKEEPVDEALAWEEQEDLQTCTG